MIIETRHPETLERCHPWTECAICYRALQIDRRQALQSADWQYARHLREIQGIGDCYICDTCVDEIGAEPGSVLEVPSLEDQLRASLEQLGAL